MSDASDAVDEAKRRNRQLAARCLVRVQDLEAQIARTGSTDALETELACAKHDYQAALAELKELDRLGAQAQTLDARSIVASIEGDPVLRSAEEIALDNAREHIADLDAQVRLGDELAPAAPAPAAKPEDPDEAARREFEALRAKPKKTL